MGHSKEKLEHQSLVTVRQTWILHSDFRGSIERVVLLCRKIVSSFVLLHIFISFLCCLAEKGQGEVSKRLKIAEKLQSVYLKIDKKTLFLVIGWILLVSDRCRNFLPSDILLVILLGKIWYQNFRHTFGAHLICRRFWPLSVC